MTNTFAKPLLLIPLLSGCITGNNYPEKFATSLCETAFTCLDSGDIEFITGYDNQDECIVDLTAEIQTSTTYDEYEEGTRSFNKDAANLCFTEIIEVQGDSDCDGSMNAWSFFTDIQSNACDDVFPTVE